MGFFPRFVSDADSKELMVVSLLTRNSKFGNRSPRGRLRILGYPGPEDEDEHEGEPLNSEFGSSKAPKGGDRERRTDSKTKGALRGGRSGTLWFKGGHREQFAAPDLILLLF